MFKFWGDVFGYPAAYFETLAKRDPWFESQNILALSSDGRPISALQIFPKLVRVGNCSVMAGGIGNLATLPECRRRGHATKLLEKAIQIMRGRGYVLSILFTGIPHFYRRLKWEMASPEYEYLISARKLSEGGKDIPSTFWPRIFRTEDSASIMQAYDCTNRGRTLSVVRSRECWQRQLDYNLSEDLSGFIVIQMHQTTLAYARCTKSQGRLEVIEAGYRPNSPDARPACKALLTCLGERALEMNLKEVSVNVPPDHILTGQLIDRGAIDISRMRGNSMIRIIDLSGLIKKILPDLKTRISDAHFSKRLTIRTEEEHVSLQIKDGEIRVMDPREGGDRYETGHRVLAQHLTGYVSPKEAFQRGLVRAEPSIVKIVDSLFRTVLPSYVWKSDRF